MILYLDSSAVVKRYVREWDSDTVQAVLGGADLVGTSVITRAEVAAALAKARRMGALSADGAAAAVSTFAEDWPNLVRLAVSEHVVGRAADVAWTHGLRAYDAVQLAAASVWQAAIGELVTLATYDVSLWTAAEATGLQPFPPDLKRRLTTRKE